jgi:uncharacterized repeat protein (TIGR03806 family)
LYVIRPASGSGSNSFPVKLSDMDALFAVGGGIGHTVDGVYPYQPAASLWSDGTTKERYLAVPGLSTIDFAETDSWGFPEGTVLVKNFLMPLDDRLPEDTLQRIETRLLIRKDGDWHGVTFEWNEDETDATLLADSKSRTFERIDAMGNPYTYQWYYPSRQDCMTCHTSVAGGVLGVNSLQLNNDFLYPASGNVDNQLGALDFVGLFSDPMPVSPNVLPRMVDYHDTQFTLAARARSYLDANCAMCHQPGGPTPATIDLRYLTSDIQSVGFLPNRGTLGIAGAQIIAPGDPWRSVLHARIESTNPAHRMPPLATSLVDEQGAALIADWITSLQLEAAAGGWQNYE